jgi:hypothetical protein
MFACKHDNSKTINNYIDTKINYKKYEKYLLVQFGLNLDKTGWKRLS